MQGREQSVKRNLAVISVLVLAGVLGGLAQHAAAQQAQPVVHAVLFYSRTCGHCEYVITQVLPPLYQKHGPQLQLMGLDVAQSQGQELFLAALEHFGVERSGVPFLVIDDIVLIGSQEIPERFPGLIDEYLALGGVDWPAIPGLQELLVAAEQTATAAAPTPAAAPGPAAVMTAAPRPALPVIGVEPGKVGWQQRFAADATANTIAVVVLVGMLAALVWGAMLLVRAGRSASVPNRPDWLIPALCVLGLAVAGYLAYVETSGVRATCGPIGDCNTVQQSPYARLFGVLSVGVVGVIGYVAMLLAWLLTRLVRGRGMRVAAVGLFLMALPSTLFSMYLTFLEPFVIGATCAWCLTSAALTTTLMLLSAPAAGSALARLRRNAA
jgi:uncharacterized membrane protein